MRRLKKKIFQGLFGSTVAILAMVKACNPDIAQPLSATANEAIAESDSIVSPETISPKPAPASASPQETPSVVAAKAEAPVIAVEKTQEPDVATTKAETPSSEASPAPFTPHPIYSVYSYDKTFPDVQDVQIVAARKWGVKPVKNRVDAEKRKKELVYVGANPYYCIDSRMTSSIPYLVPRASILLQTIAKNYLDSLYIKGIPLHRIIVSSVLRTEEDVARLRKHNGNASEQSCHRFGTTFDIAYNRYSTVSPPEGPKRRSVQNDTLKWVLSEVLRDIRQKDLCYIKYEVKQGCFHITVR